MLEIKISTWQYNALCSNIVQIYSSPLPLFEKKEDREKERQKQKLFVMDALLKLIA